MLLYNAPCPPYDIFSVLHLGYKPGAEPPVKVMASRSQLQWRKPSLLHNFVKNKAKRGSKVLWRRSTPFSVAVPSVYTEAGGQADHELAGELHDDTTDMQMDIDGGALPDIDNDDEPMRYGNW